MKLAAVTFLGAFIVTFGALTYAKESGLSIGQPGLAACTSETNNTYSAQFGWDKAGKLTDVSLRESLGDS